MRNVLGKRTAGVNGWLEESVARVVGSADLEVYDLVVDLDPRGARCALLVIS